MRDRDGAPTRTPPEAPAGGSRRLIETIRASVIGEDEAVAGPFGLRRVTYADYTASGRSLSFIDDYIRDAVLPLYANTHTESSGTGLQTVICRFPGKEVEIVRSDYPAGELEDLLSLVLKAVVDKKALLKRQAAGLPCLSISP